MSLAAGDRRTSIVREGDQDSAQETVSGWPFVTHGTSEADVFSQIPCPLGAGHCLDIPGPLWPSPACSHPGTPSLRQASDRPACKHKYRGALLLQPIAGLLRCIGARTVQMECEVRRSHWHVSVESKQKTDLKASEASVASAWCGGMWRTFVASLMISSCMAHTRLSISPHRAEQVRRPSSARPSDWAAGAVSTHAYSSERAAVLRSTFVALACAAFSPT